MVNGAPIQEACDLHRMSRSSAPSCNSVVNGRAFNVSITVPLLIWLAVSRLALDRIDFQLVVSWFCRCVVQRAWCDVATFAIGLGSHWIQYWVRLRPCRVYNYLRPWCWGYFLGSGAMCCYIILWNVKQPQDLKPSQVTYISRGEV